MIRPTAGPSECRPGSGAQPRAQATQAAASSPLGNAEVRGGLTQGVASEKKLQQRAIGRGEPSQELDDCHLGCLVFRRGLQGRWRDEWTARPQPLEAAEGYSQTSGKVRKEKTSKTPLTRPVGEKLTEDDIAFVANIVQLSQAYPGTAGQHRADAVEVGSEPLVEPVAQQAVAALGQSG